MRDWNKSAIQRRRESLDISLRQERLPISERRKRARAALLAVPVGGWMKKKGAA